MIVSRPVKEDVTLLKRLKVRPFFVFIYLKAHVVELILY